ncbi:unnamed protein product [Amaranthus hypochondriacus]
MAVDLLTDNPSSRGLSPRISFSHDLKNSDIIPIESQNPLKSSSLLDYDFDFCVSKTSYDHDSSSADELFSNGVILPIQIKKENIPIISKSKSFTQSSQLPSSSSVLEKTEEKQGNNNKSFWMFKRSKSLNCSSIYRKGLCSLYILSRSKSTGSTISGKRSLISNDETHNHQHHQQQNGNGKQSSMKKLSSSYHQKPPLKKYYGGSSFNSGLIQVSPVLNVPTGKVFGFGSLFSTGKDKIKKK